MSSDDGVGQAVGREVEGAGGEASEFFCGMTKGEEGGFRGSLLVDFRDFCEGADEKAGTSALGTDLSVSCNEGATSFTAAGKINVGRGGFKVELDRLRDDEPACRSQKGDGIPPQFTTGMVPNDLTPSILREGKFVGDEGSIAESSSIDPKATKSRHKQGVGDPKKMNVTELASHALLSTRNWKRSSTTWVPEQARDLLG